MHYRAQQGHGGGLEPNHLLQGRHVCRQSGAVRTLPVHLLTIRYVDFYSVSKSIKYWSPSLPVKHMKKRWKFSFDLKKRLIVRQNYEVQRRAYKTKCPNSEMKHQILSWKVDITRLKKSQNLETESHYLMIMTYCELFIFILIEADILSYFFSLLLTGMASIKKKKCLWNDGHFIHWMNAISVTEQKWLNGVSSLLAGYLDNVLPAIAAHLNQALSLWCAFGLWVYCTEVY